MPGWEDYEDDYTTVVKKSTNWGFCSPLCDIESEAKKLQETKLTTLSINECKSYNTSILSYRPDTEICAGSKRKWPTMPVYERKRLRKSSPNGPKKYTFIFKRHIKATVRKVSSKKSGFSTTLTRKFIYITK
jgi:hypothetical protein